MLLDIIYIAKNSTRLLVSQRFPYSKHTWSTSWYLRQALRQLDLVFLEQGKRMLLNYVVQRAFKTDCTMQTNAKFGLSKNNITKMITLWISKSLQICHSSTCFMFLQNKDKSQTFQLYTWLNLGCVLHAVAISNIISLINNFLFPYNIPHGFKIFKCTRCCLYLNRITIIHKWCNNTLLRKHWSKSLITSV